MTRDDLPRLCFFFLISFDIFTADKIQDTVLLSYFSFSPVLRAHVPFCFASWAHGRLSCLFDVFERLFCAQILCESGLFHIRTRFSLLLGWIFRIMLSTWRVKLRADVAHLAKPE